MAHEVFLTTSFTSGQEIDLDQQEALVRALAALGVYDDNNGEAILGRGVWTPLAWLSMEPTLKFGSLSATATVIVPTSMFFVVTHLGVTGASAAAAATITPSGGAAITIYPSATAAGISNMRPVLILGEGDALHVSSNMAAAGYFCEASAGTGTRILRTVNNAGGASTYTVGGGNIFLLTTVLSVTTAATARIVIDGNTGPLIAHMVSTAAVGALFPGPVIPFKAGQTIAGSAAAPDLLINGLEMVA